MEQQHRQYINGTGFWPTAANVGLRLLERHGLATLLVLAGCWWGSVHVANPLVASTVSLMAKLSESQTKIVEVQEAQAETQEAQTVILQEIRQRLDRLEDSRGAMK